MNTILTTQFARIHTSFLINIEMMINRPFSKFCNGDIVNVITEELRLIERNIIFYKKQFQQIQITFCKLNVKNGSVCMA